MSNEPQRDPSSYMYLKRRPSMQHCGSSVYTYLIENVFKWLSVADGILWKSSLNLALLRQHCFTDQVVWRRWPDKVLL